MAGEQNTVKTIIFTVLVGFDQKEDIAFLHKISEIFLSAGQPVYFVELVAQLEERIARNRQEARLKAKPSKRDLAFSHQELLTFNEKYRLESHSTELASLFPKVKTMKIDNTELSPEMVSQKIIANFQLEWKIRRTLILGKQISVLLYSYFSQTSDVAVKKPSAKEKTSPSTSITDGY